jgi:hypothetical protein
MSCFSRLLGVVSASERRAEIKTGYGAADVPMPARLSKDKPDRIRTVQAAFFICLPLNVSNPSWFLTKFPFLQPVGNFCGVVSVFSTYTICRDLICPRPIPERHRVQIDQFAELH